MLAVQDTTNQDQLEHCWEQAAQLAINYQRHRMKDVVGTVSERLQEIGRHQAAGELHESIDDVQVGVGKGHLPPIDYGTSGRMRALLAPARSISEWECSYCMTTRTY